MSIWKNVSFEKIFLMILANRKFTFKIGNSKVVKDIFPGKISHDLW